MRVTDIILKKRSAQVLSKEEIDFLIDGYSNGSVPDYQMSALLMAIFLNGMTAEETAHLTTAMLNSGSTINLASYGLEGPFVDKHSTGGVGDKISLPLAPIVAALGVKVPMMSGRALGHTGGTLDKLESIAGYNVNLSEREFASIIGKVGYAMMGQTGSVAPADKKMYALRDVTATVESIPLITASILSKKIAEGADALVFDVKFGRGAFMKSVDDARRLAHSLVGTVHEMGKQACALLTNMDSPLGFKVGNFLEIEETLECLEGKGPADVMELTYEIGARMLLFSKKAKDIDEGKALCAHAVADGSALKKFLENVEAQGGDPGALLREQGKRRSKFRAALRAKSDGFLDVDAYKVGHACVTLGVGRAKTDDAVDADSGIIFAKRGEDAVKEGDLIMEVFAKNDAALKEGCALLEDAYTIQSVPPPARPLVLETIS